MIVKYRRLYPYAPYLNEEIGFEKSIPTDDEVSALAAVLELKDLADKAHQKINPAISISDNNNGDVVGEQQVDRRIGVLVEDILSCQDLKTLDTYKLLLRSSELLEAYNQRYKELS